ncbi:MAG: helix-turn-helix transcriptional regulator [Eubacteriaceae bacterium]|nr:helix-turn-helix transcriptional regulator [Eubacteriaceae bacterium]
MENITGKRIRERRKIMGMTLAQVAAQVGVSRQTIQRYETGVIRNIPKTNIELLAKALGTTPVYLVGWNENI